MKRLVVIDGNAVMHRAYHAIPPLTTKDGTPTNAVYGFITMMLRIVSDLKPTHLIVVFDRPAPTFRKKLYEQYQATRPKMDDELSVQIGIIHEVLEAFAVSVYEQDGFEADDVIGTIVAKSHRHKKTEDGVDQVIVVTGDRDILQLVDDEHVYVYMPTKGLSTAKLYDKNATIKKLGIPPEQVADFKALSGDSSDNYPGVAGIGPKTAQSLLSQFGSVEGIYKALEAGVDGSMPQKMRDKLTENKETALLFKHIATIRNDVPVEIALPKAAIHTFDTKDVHAVLEKYGFISLIRRLSPQDEEIKTKETAKETKKSNDDDTEQLSLV